MYIIRRKTKITGIALVSFGEKKTLKKKFINRSCFSSFNTPKVDYHILNIVKKNKKYKFHEIQ